MSHRPPLSVPRAHRPRHRARRRLVPTLVSVGAAYVVTALVVVLVVTLVLPVAAHQRPSRTLAAATLAAQGAPAAATPATATRAAAALAGRETSRPSRSMPRTVIRRASRPAPVARRVVIRRITWALPVSGYHLTGRFGDRSYLWSSGMHTGLDFAAPTGTQIRAIASGVVRGAGWAGAYGYRTVISLPGGGEAWYCHQSSVSVAPGQRVRAGQPIGAVGATGNVTGSHLHLELRPHGEHGAPVDPYAVLVAHGLHP